jgi:TolA-binding protein
VLLAATNHGWSHAPTVTITRRLAESLLRARVDQSVRASALLFTADASYAAEAYGQAAARYSGFVTAYPQSPDAARAAMARGWSELRAGQRDRARQAWIDFASRYPNDPRAPLALALCSELGRQTTDRTPEKQLLARYATSPYAGVAKVNRALLAVRAQREDAAVRDLEEVLREHGVVVIEERRRLVEAIVTPNAAPIERPLAGKPAARDNGDPIDRAALLVDRRDREGGPYLLHGLVLLAATNHGWSHAPTVTITRRLAEVFPSYEPTAPLLSRIGTSAASSGQWPVARRAYETLATRYADTPAARSTRVAFGEALYRTGATGEAKRVLEKAAATGGDDGARALLLLADCHESTGDRGAALAAYDRVQRDHPKFQRSPRSLLAHARLLEQSKDPARARVVLQNAIGAAKGEEAAENAYRLGQALRAEGQDAAAVEWYMTAAYVAKDSYWAHQAMLAAAAALSVLGERQQALTLYLKLATNGGETRSEAAQRAAELDPAAGIRHEAAQPSTNGLPINAGAAARPVKQWIPVTDGASTKDSAARAR